MSITIHPTNPQPRLISQVADRLRDGAVIVYPTDTVYGLGCSIHNRKAIERICRIKGVKPDKAQLSCICEDLKRVGELSIHVDTPVFKLMKRALPGPYTFILEASREVPKHFQTRNRTVGIRVVDNPIALALVRELGHPIVSTSLREGDDYPTEPWEIEEGYGNQVDLVIDGGPGGSIPSTVIDCSNGNEVEIIREGLGDLDIL